MPCCQIANLSVTMALYVVANLPICLSQWLAAHLLIGTLVCWIAAWHALPMIKFWYYVWCGFLLNNDDLYKINTFMFVYHYVKVLRFARLTIARLLSPMIKSWYSDWYFSLNSLVFRDKIVKTPFSCVDTSMSEFFAISKIESLVKTR
jgi:hypothetical protein